MRPRFAHRSCGFVRPAPKLPFSKAPASVSPQDCRSFESWKMQKPGDCRAWSGFDAQMFFAAECAGNLFIHFSIRFYRWKISERSRPTGHLNPQPSVMMMGMNTNPYQAPRFGAKTWVDAAMWMFLAAAVLCLLVLALLAKLVHDTHGSHKVLNRPGRNAPRGGESAPAQTPT